MSFFISEYNGHFLWDDKWVQCFPAWGEGSYLFSPQGYWYQRRRNCGCGTTVEGQHNYIALGFTERILKRVYWKRSWTWSVHAFGHALTAPTLWQNSIWKRCDCKSLAKDRILPAGLLLLTRIHEPWKDRLVFRLAAGFLHPCIPTGTPYSPPSLFLLPAFPTLVFMAKEYLRHDKAKIPWGQFTRDIFWWHAALQWAVLWNLCWTWCLSSTFITSSSWLTCSLLVSPSSLSLGLWMAGSRNAEADSWSGNEGHWRISSETLATLPGCYTIQRQNQYACDFCCSYFVC